MSRRVGLVVVLAVLGAVAVQSSVLGRFRFGSIAPDLLLVVVVLASLRTTPVAAICIGFGAGLLFDSLSADAFGLRALVLTSVAFAAARTKERAKGGPIAASVWIGALSMFGVVLLSVVGTLFGQIELAGGQIMRRIVLVPLLNVGVAFLITPVVERLLRPVRRFV